MALTLFLLEENSVIGWRVVEALLAPRILNIASYQGARKASTTCHPSDIVILKFQSKCHSTYVARLACYEMWSQF
jgi:hypothetical protein